MTTATTETVTAPPYTAQQCPRCEIWLYANDGPFAEGGDRTKPETDWIHWSTVHQPTEPPAEPIGGIAIGFPYFPWNEQPVQALRAVAPNPATAADVDIEPMVAHVMAAVTEDGLAGAPTFSALHDHVDANEYLINAVAASAATDIPLARRLAEPADDPEVFFGDFHIDICNRLADAVDALLSERWTPSERFPGVSCPACGAWPFSDTGAAEAHGCSS